MLLIPNANNDWTRSWFILPTLHLQENSVMQYAHETWRNPVRNGFIQNTPDPGGLLKYDLGRDVPLLLLKKETHSQCNLSINKSFCVQLWLANQQP